MGGNNDSVSPSEHIGGLFGRVNKRQVQQLVLGSCASASGKLRRVAGSLGLSLPGESQNSLFSLHGAKHFSMLPWNS